MKNKKSRNIKIILFSSCILLLEVMLYIHKNNIIPTFSYEATTEAEIKDELIIALFMDNIKTDSNSFYNHYFSTELEYFNYEFKIKDIDKENGYIHVTFGLTPMIGAHNPVGYDEVTYKVNVFGEKTLEQFIHLKSYDIPERYQEFIINPLPL